MNSQAAINATLRTKLNTAPEVVKSQHRFVPGENPRSVNTTKDSSQPNLASEVSFSPVTSFSAGNGETFVRAVKNTHQRAMSPRALNQEGQVSIRGERVIELGSNLHQQIRAKVNKEVNYKKETLIAPENLGNNPIPTVKPKPISPPTQNLTPEQTKVRNDELKKQLEEINKQLFEQIRHKITSEISRQKGQSLPVASNQPKAPTFTGSRVLPAQPVTNPTASSQLPPAAVQPLAAPKQNSAINQPTGQPTAQTQPVLNQRQNTLKPVVSKPALPTAVAPKNESVQGHIENLEKEIEVLTKEIAHIDQTISNLEQEQSLQQVSAVQQKLATDEKMMQAVTDWKYTLTNLVNSHSLALKYLKQKTDWLEDKVENIEGHRAKHEKMHRKPREINLKIEAIPKPQPEEKLRVAAPSQEAKPIVGQIELVQESKNEPKVGQVVEAVKFVQTQAPTEIKMNVPDTTVTSNAAVVQSTLTQPPEIKEIIKKEEAKPEQVQAVVEKAWEAKKTQLQPKVIEKEVLAEKVVAEKVQDLVKKELEKQKQATETSEKPVENKLSAQEVERLVADALEKQKGHATAQLKPSLTVTADSNGNHQIEIPANLTVGQPKVLPGNPEAQINVQAIPVETSLKPKENLPTVATGAALSSQSDIERQILESAAREEAAKEAVQKAKEERERKLKETAEKAKIQTATKPPEAQAVSAEMLKEDLTKLKSTLTTIDNKSLEGLSREERAQMIQKLDTLQHQSEVSRQLDDIKAAAERRKVNTELQQMLEKLGEKPKTVVQTPAQSPTTSPTKQVETLKEEEKKERSPEEKARIIAEIKSLEREREARKLEERSRPVVKAQPAYGKMLPNTPTIPNVINGIVKSNTGLLMDTVVIIVKDQEGDPVRAFKTNKIGQFAVSTPLPNGVYTLELEKPGADFDIIEVEVNGGILPPIEIKAR